MATYIHSTIRDTFQTNSPFQKSEFDDNFLDIFVEILKLYSDISSPIRLRTHTEVQLAANTIMPPMEKCNHRGHPKQ